MLRRRYVAPRCLRVGASLHAHVTHVSWLLLLRQVYRKDDRCLPPKPDPGMGSSKKELVERRLASRGYEKPFVQSHPGKSGYNWYVRSEQVTPGALPLT